jgi:hypothetical protein
MAAICLTGTQASALAAFSSPAVSLYGCCRFSYPVPRQCQHSRVPEPWHAGHVACPPQEHGIFPAFQIPAVPLGLQTAQGVRGKIGVVIAEQPSRSFD